MATYEELMQSAEQIRTNELPESNTHELVGQHLKNQVEYSKNENNGLKTLIDNNKKEVDGKLAELENKTKGIVERIAKNPSSNLCDPEQVIDGLSVRQDGSTSSSTSGYGVIYVPIDEEGLTVSKSPAPSGTRYHALFDENMQFISGSQTQSNTINYSEGAKYAGLSIQGDYSKVMINRGSLAIDYTPYNPFEGYGLLDNNSTLNGENISKDSVSYDKINKNLFIYPYKTEESITVDYNGTIGELYIIAKAPEGYNHACKCYDNQLYVRPRKDGNITDSWQSVTPISGFVNNKVYELKCTKSGGGVELNETIGYVVFSDIDKFRSLSFGGTAPLYNNAVTDVSNFIQISNYLYKPEASTVVDGAISTDKIADNAITSDKVADNAIGFDKISSEIEYYTTANKYNYKGAIAELYVFPEHIPEDTGLSSKGYGGEFYIRPTNRVWNAKISGLSAINNDEVVEIKCTTAGGGVEVGQIVGYVIFKDKQIFIDAGVIDGGVGEDVNVNSATTLIPWGRLQPYINGIDGHNIKSGSITQDKLDPSISLASALELGVDIYIPDEVTAVVGDTLQIFWRSIVHAFNPYIFDIQSECSVGKHYPRYYTFTPTESQAGQKYELKIKIRKNDLSVLVEKTTTIRVVAKPTSPASQTNILCIGASATEGGMWPYELMRRLTQSDGDGTPYNPTGLGLSNISFVGRKTATPSYGHTIKLEATGGWRVQDYAGTGQRAYRFYVSGVTQLNINDQYSAGGAVFTITEINVTEGSGNIRCTYTGTPSLVASGTLTRSKGEGDETITYSSYADERYNPFWNEEENKLDFRSYADEYCEGSIDLQIWHCGVNDLAGTVSIIPTIIESYKSILRAYHTDFPNGKVIITSIPVGSVNGGFGANYGASSIWNYFTFMDAAQKYAKALIEMCREEEFESYVTYSPVLEEFDSEYGYPTTDVAVNNRSDITEAVGTNAVHPISGSSKMVSDAVYRSFSAL